MRSDSTTPGVGCERMNEPAAPRERVARATWPLVAGTLAIALIVGVTVGRRDRSAMAAGDSLASTPGATGATPRQASQAHGSRARAEFSMAERGERRKAAQIEQERKARAFHAMLAARYAAEPVDAAWAGAKEAKLLAASASDEMRRIDALPGNYRATCRSSVCRIGADFPNRSAAQDWLTLFSTGVGSELPNESYIVSQNQDGSIHLEIMGLAKK